MCEVFGGKQSILPSALLGSFGGLKRKVKMEHDNEEEDAAVRKKVTFQKAKAPPMVQMLREINEEKKRAKKVKSDAYNARTDILKECFFMLAEAIKLTRN